MEGNKNEMSSDKVAELLVKLYADYQRSYKERLLKIDPNYAQAVAIAIRMLTD